MQAVAPLIPHRPTPPQWEFLALSCEEALYGGAAGGGKSDALLMAALQFADVPGYAAAVFRRSKPEHEQPGAPRDRAKTWLRPAIEQGRVTYLGDEKSTFLIHTKGAPSVLHFGYFGGEHARSRYVGAEFQFIGVDEVQFWRERDYRWLFSRCRGPEEWKGKVPNRMRATGNPGGPGHRWVKARFVEQAHHIERGSDARTDVAARRKGTALPSPRVYVSTPSKEAIELANEFGTKAQGCYFVPAFAEDNPFLNLADYRSKLALMSPEEREWYQWGNWDAEPTGGFFRPEHFEFVDATPDLRREGRGWDFAATEAKPGTDPDWSAGVRAGAFEDAAKKVRVIVTDVERFREEPGPTEARFSAIVSKDGRKVLQVLEQEPGGAGKAQKAHLATTALVGHQFEFERRTGPKSAYWKPISGGAQFAPLVLLRGDWNAEFVDELLALPVGHDDQADALGILYPRLVKPKVVFV